MPWSLMRRWNCRLYLPWLTLSRNDVAAHLSQVGVSGKAGAVQSAIININAVAALLVTSDLSNDG